MRVSLLVVVVMLLNLMPVHAGVLSGNIQFDREIKEDAHQLKNFHGKANERTKESNWYRIPQWLGGTWKISKETQIYSYDNITREEDWRTHNFDSHRTVRYGIQKDSTNVIWDKHHLPQVAEVDGGDHLEFQRILKKVVKVNAEGAVISRVLAEVIRADKRTGDCIMVFTQVTEDILKPLSPTLVLSQSRNQAFDKKGRPVFLTKNTAVMTRVQPFIAINEEDGEDIRGKFLSFVAESGDAPLVVAEAD